MKFRNPFVKQRYNSLWPHSIHPRPSERGLKEAEGGSDKEAAKLEGATVTEVKPTKSGRISTKDGTPYEELSNEQLSVRFNSISKALKKDDLTEEQRAEYKAKQNRISEIFKERNKQEEA